MGDGKLLAPPAPPKRRIEVIGDSISCGYGNEGKTKEEDFRPETENGYLAYGPLAARAVGADCTVVAWSGRKMWPDNDIPSIYDLAVPTEPTAAWSFRGDVPDAFVIHLATNDFGQANPDEKGWTEAYEAFVARLRKRAPRAQIYCAMGSMMGDEWPPERKALSTLRGYLDRMVGRLKEAGDGRVSRIEFDQQREEDGIGSDWHPSLTTHRKMADRLAGALRRDLNW